MRSRAAAISASTPGARLPVPPARDEVSRLAETLNEMLARLEASLEHERRFVADASHELRTPLALLKTELEVALRRRRTREELEAALASASEETDRLTRLAEDLLLIARSDAGELPLRRERVGAAEVLGVVAERFSRVADERGRALEVVSPNGLELDADPVRVEQALGNLVANALAHGDGRVVLSAQAREALVELHVEDEGPGFPPGFIGGAFDRFSRSDDSRSGGGSGLGLSIVELIARAHGGSVGAENRAAGGADVWIAVSRPGS
jgi:signal transduction histidine kinase